MHRMIGLVGGLGPHATVYYYRSLVGGCAAHPSDLRLLINHADVGLVLRAAAAGDHAAMAAHLSARLEQLATGGAEVFAIAALTPHACAAELGQSSAHAVIDPIDVLNVHLANAGVRRVLLLGTASSMGSRLFGRLQAEAPLPPEDVIRRLHDLYVGIVATGEASGDGPRELVALAREWAERLSVDAIVLAGTELALVERRWWAADLQLISCADLHVSAILAAARA